MSPDFFVQCPDCSHSFPVQQEFNGKNVSCKKCSHEFLVKVSTGPVMKEESKQPNDSVEIGTKMEGQSVPVAEVVSGYERIGESDQRPSKNILLLITSAGAMAVVVIALVVTAIYYMPGSSSPNQQPVTTVLKPNKEEDKLVPTSVQNVGTGKAEYVFPTGDDYTYQFEKYVTCNGYRFGGPGKIKFSKNNDSGSKQDSPFPISGSVWIAPTSGEVVTDGNVLTIPTLSYEWNFERTIPSTGIDRMKEPILEETKKPYLFMNYHDTLFLPIEWGSKKTVQRTYFTLCKTPRLFWIKGIDGRNPKTNELEYPKEFPTHKMSVIESFEVISEGKTTKKLRRNLTFNSGFEKDLRYAGKMMTDYLFDKQKGCIVSSETEGSGTVIVNSVSKPFQFRSNITLSGVITQAAKDAQLAKRMEGFDKWKRIMKLPLETEHTVNGLAFHPNGQIYCGRSKGSILVTNSTKTGWVPFYQLDGYSSFSNIQFSKDYQYLFANNFQFFFRIPMEDPTTDVKKIELERVYDKIVNVAVHPNGELVALAFQSGVCEIWNLKSEKLVNSHRLEKRNAQAVRFTEDGKKLLYTDGRSLMEIDSSTGDLIRQFQFRKFKTETVAFSPDLETIITKKAQYVDLYHTQTGKRIQAFRVDQYGDVNIEFSRDGKYFILWKEHIYYFDRDTGKVAKKYYLQNSRFFNDFNQSEDGKQVGFFVDERDRQYCYVFERLDSP